MKKNKSIVLIVLCIIAAVIAVLIFKKQSATVDMTQSNGKTTEEKLFSFRTEYIGDASKSSMIAQNLKLDDSFSYYATSLETAAEKPKGITIVYNSLDGNTGLSKAEKYKFIYNSLVVFSLIGNCEVVTASVNKDGTVLPLESIQRDFAVKLLGYDPFTKTTTLDEFKKYMQEIEKIDYAAISLPSTNLEDSITTAINSRYKGQLYSGEFATSGHITLSTETDGSNTTVTVYLSYYEFQFENGVFEKCADATGPAKLVFSKDALGNYSLVEFLEPVKKGNQYNIALQTMFSDEDIAKINNIEFDESQKQIINDQIIATVKDYLTYIGRSEAKIALDYQEKNYPPLDPKNAILFDVLYKAYQEYPYYAGSIERMENGVRYEYKTDYEKQGTSDVFTYTKTNTANQKVEEKVKLELNGSDVKVLEGTIRNEYTKYKQEYDKDIKANQGQNN